MIKLSDCELEVRPTHSESARSRLCYTAPELIEEKSDVWSLGISLIELAEGKNPYAGYKPLDVVRAIRENPPPTLSGERWSAEFVDFVSQCLVKDVKDRAALRELIDAGRFWEE